MQSNAEAAAEVDVTRPHDDEMMSIGTVLEYFGGDTPLHYSTLYRGIAAGRYPKPVSIGPNSRRWLRSECREARQKLIDARDNELPNPQHRGLGRRRGGRAALGQGTA